MGSCKSYFLMSVAFVLVAASCTRSYDVLVVGGGCGGVSAGIQAARMGMNTMVVEEGPWLGGMLTSAGVCGIDGNYDMRGGIFAEFCDSLAARYGGYDRLSAGWVSHMMFCPDVGASVFDNIAAKEPGLAVVRNTVFESVAKEGDGWKVSFRRQDGKRFAVKAKILIDGTELGDVAAAAGVRYSLGMDSRYDTGESVAPEKANGIIQDMTWVAILQDYGPDADMTVKRPDGYDRSRYVNSCLNSLNDPSRPVRMLWPPDSVLTYGRLPSGDMYMLNWPIEGNDCYVNVVEASREEREAGYDRAKEMTLGFIYFLQTELGMKNIGIAENVFPTGDGLALIPYHREGRRIEGEVLFTVDYAARPYDVSMPLYRTGIAVGNYAVDHHHGRYSGSEELPDLHFYPIPSFNVPMGCLRPAEVDNLLVADKPISVTNIMNGATRVQPVTMQMGQAAGIMAALAVSSGRSVKDVEVREVQDALLDNGGYIMPYSDLSPSDRGFAAVQRTGAAGILRGEWTGSGWTNSTEFRPDEPLMRADLIEGLADFPEAIEYVRGSGDTDYVAYSELPGLFRLLGSSVDMDAAASESGVEQRGGGDCVSRLEFAMLLDASTDIFSISDVEVSGLLRDSSR